MSIKTMEILKFIIALITLLIALGIWKWIQGKWVHFRKSRQTINDVQNVVNKAVMDDLKAIKAQVYPDGGNSMSDKITVVAEEIVVIDQRLKAVDIKLIDLKTGQRNKMEIMDIPFWESNNEGGIIYASKSLCETIGCTQNDLLNGSWLGWVDLKDRKRVEEEWLDSVRTASGFNSFFTFRRTDGTLQQVKAEAIHTKDDRGKVLSTLVRVIKIDEPFKK